MDINVQQLHKVLGLEYPATKEQIKRAFYKFAHVHHPDKGGDEAEFKKINNAYSILMKDHYWHILRDERTVYGQYSNYANNYGKPPWEWEYPPGEGPQYSEADRNKHGKKQHKGNAQYSRSKYKPLDIFCNDEGTKFWTQDEDGYVVSFYGEPEPFEEEIYH